MKKFIEELYTTNDTRFRPSKLFFGGGGRGFSSYFFIEMHNMNPFCDMTLNI